jgi:membrane-associated phospholipid phosphatase
VGPDEPGLRPVDAITLVYLAVTTCLLVAFQGNLPTWGALTLLHVAAGVLLLRAGAKAPPRHPVARLLRDFYFVVGQAFFYWEFALLTQLSGTGLHDARVAGWEEALFGGQPSQTWRASWPAGVLAQYLHLAYFLYYLVPLSLSLTLYLSRRWAAFQEAMSVHAVSFFVCGLAFIAFPVAGPYHHFGPPDPAAFGGGVAALAHGVVRAGSSVGTAFPSSHVAIAVAVWVAALRLDRRVFWGLALVVPGLALGTVYGGFHYLVDTLAGVAVGVASALLGRKLHETIARRLPRPGRASGSARLAALPKSGEGA